MKKWVFILFFAISGFLLGGCDLIPPDTTVVNESSYAVTFRYSHNDKATETLTPNAQAHTKYSYSSILIEQPEKRVQQKRDQSTNIITISDLSSWEVRAENKTASPVTLTANGWMDNMVDIPSGDFVDDNAHKGTVFHKTPPFVVESSAFPVDLQWQFKDDIFYVKIY